MTQDLETEKNDAEIFGEIRNMVLKKTEDDKMANDVTRWNSWTYKREEDASEQYPAKKRQLRWTYPKKKVSSPLCQWKANKKENNVDSWWYEKKKRILGTKEGNEYLKRLKKKQLFARMLSRNTHPWTC